MRGTGGTPSCSRWHWWTWWRSSSSPRRPGAGSPAGPCNGDAAAAARYGGPLTGNPLLHAPIPEVTVFQDGARVLRKGRLAVPAGSPTVVLSDLPPSVDTASV